MYYQRLIRIIFIFLAYLILGKVGLFFAIPPGYASAIFPSSGLALICVFLWGPSSAIGVFLGSFLLNLSLIQDISSFNEYAVPFLISLGAVLQASISSFLIRQKFDKIDFSNIRFIFTFIILGAGIGCLINSVWSVGFLYLSNTIAKDQLFYNWFYWYLGDFLGVVTFGPIVYIYSVREFGERLRDRLKASIPIFCSFALFAGMYFYISEYEINTARQAFHRDVDFMKDTFNKEVELMSGKIESLESFYLQSNYVSWNEFEGFAGRLLDKDNPSQALFWVENIEKDSRLSFNQRMKKENPYFTEVYYNNKLHGSEAKNINRNLLPITYSVPVKENEKLFGYDLFSDEHIFDTLILALESRRSLSIYLTEKQDSLQNLNGMLVVLPVYHFHGKKKAISEFNPFKNLKGYLIIRYSVEDMWKNILNELGFSNYQFKFWVNTSKSKSPSLKIKQGSMLKLKEESFTKGFSVDFYNKDAFIEMKVMPQEYFKKMKLSSWYVLLFGMMITGILGIFSLYVLTTRRLILKEKQQGARRSAAMDEFVRKNTRNITLGQLASGMSHELNNPLSIISALSSRNLSRIKTKNYEIEESQKDYEMIQHSVDRIDKIISTLKKVGNEDINGEPKLCRVDNLLKDSLDLIKERYKNHNIDISIHGAPNIEVFCNPIGIIQVFFSILQFSYDHIHDQENSWIEIRFELLDDSLRIRFVDSAPALIPSEADKLFSAFHYIEPSKDSKIPLGLEVSSELVQSYKGKIFYEDFRGRGSVALELLRSLPKKETT